LIFEHSILISTLSLGDKDLLAFIVLISNPSPSSLCRQISVSSRRGGKDDGGGSCNLETKGTVCSASESSLWREKATRSGTLKTIPKKGESKQVLHPKCRNVEIFNAALHVCDNTGAQRRSIASQNIASRSMEKTHLNV
jgi:hypothetical protein